MIYFILSIFLLTPTLTLAQDIGLNAKLDILIKTYPNILSHHQNNMLYFKNGLSPMQIDDGRPKNHKAKLAQADIEDTLSQIYPMGPCAVPPQTNFDPGRIRSDKLMRRLYGQTKSQARRNLTSIRWFGRRVKISKKHGAARALLAVRNDIKKKPHLRKYVRNIGGTFYWRKIAGTSRLSAHSFGIAIDINTKYAAYWRWQKNKRGGFRKARNKYPLELIAIFENHGYIWGGRWYHYDTMHFEYRPELIAIAKASNSGNACAIQ
ncbi:hypothetical protein TI05_12465 [Achromatium sp. WMS3]|nr:hypothetical protein TI05_12465 [Achromatium sp. WMS3]